MARNKKGQAPHKLNYAPSRRFTLDPHDPAMVQLAESLPAGRMAVLANENARYTSFQASCAALIMPYGSRISFHTGCYVVDSSNRAVDDWAPKEDWVMLMGDDHMFPQHMAMKLLALMYKNDLDIIVPLCFKRSFPPTPVLYNLGTDGYPYPINLNDYPSGGLVEVYCAGTAGMIIRKRVIEAFYHGKDVPIFQLGGKEWGEDLDFCRRARENHGFRIWADLDMPLGHTVNATLWPTRDGAWGCQYDFNQQGGFLLNL